MNPMSRVPGYALLVAAFIFAAPALLPNELGGTALAQEEKENKSAPRSGRKSASMSVKVGDMILEVTELLDAEKYNEALAILNKVKAMPKLTDYEKVNMYSMYGYLYFALGDFNKAIDSYETLLQQPDLPEPAMQQAIRTLAQLAFVKEDYQAAIGYANRYMDMLGPDSDMYALIGTAYYSIAAAKANPTKADFQKIVPPVDKAMSLAREKGLEMKENWWLLLRVAYWEQDNYPKVREVLEQLVIGWPKKEYWTQLSGVYYELKDEPRQLGAYEAAYDQGLLEKSSELVQLAQLFLQAEAPYKGARVLEKGFKAEQVESTVSNLRLYSQAWQMAAEDRKAIPPLKEAAGLSDDGELYARLAQSYLNLSEHKDCIDASKKALNKGGLKNQGNVYLIYGMCQYETDQLSAAKATFRRALKYEKAAKTASSWIAYVESEEARLKQLEDSLKRARQALGETQASLVE
ncbi:MAG: hypothetical protein QF790_02125 [Gammaproteobacteria bacterium]|jgi:tetratricopeptide (TPR) repeat protein|nr:hypothetical protein [Gammaproteobacteria bacterium]MDP6615947.1 hypothetical protein [Gammaproteobacteria bacterium]MDP6695014.1 hypothetical protein [Gammaproteobacteria bacterium]MDP7041620.1 hypothetical protein [Gammaproteobacteria bacterium]